ncbi:bacteriocin [Clostridium sporogenes]
MNNYKKNSQYKVISKHDLENINGGLVGGAIAGAVLGGAVLGGAAGVTTAAIHGAYKGSISGNKLWKGYTSGALGGAAWGLASPV